MNHMPGCIFAFGANCKVVREIENFRVKQISLKTPRKLPGYSG